MAPLIPLCLVIRSVLHASGLATACTVTLNPDTVLPSDLLLIFQINLTGLGKGED